MKRSFFPVLLAFAIWAPQADALSLTNLRIITGPLGSVRSTTKFLPGDVLYFTFDAQGVQADEKTGYVKYQTKMEIFDSQAKRQLLQLSPIKELPLLGGDRLLIDAYAFLGADQDPGRYQVKITVQDLTAKEEKTLTFDFEISRKEFGLIQPILPAVGFAGQDYKMGFAVVEMKRDKKELPDVKLSMNVENEIGRKVFKEDVTLNVRDLHDPLGLDLTKKAVVNVYLPLFLSQPGRFTVVIRAEDTLANRQAEMRLPVRVLDPGEYTGR